MRLVTWNLAGRVESMPRQVEALGALAADLVVLQEVRHRLLGPWSEALAGLGLPHIAPSRVPGSPLGRDERVLDVLVAARWPADLLAGVQERMPWPERVVGALVRAPGGPVEVYGVHAPISTREGQVKVRTLEALIAGLTAPRSRPRILAGDLNTPRSEGPAGEIETFAFARSGAPIPGRGARHDAAERGILTLDGFADAYRAVHGHGGDAVSWSPRPDRDRGGHRLDHVLVTPELEPAGAVYAHACRRAGLSDHSPLVVDLRRDDGP